MLQQRFGRRAATAVMWSSALAISGFIGVGSAGASEMVTARMSPHLPATITTTSLPEATVGTPYATTLAQSGAKGQVHWGIQHRESLPRGLHLASKSGVISGIPRAAGSSTVDVLVVNKTDHALGRATIVITVNGAPTPSASNAVLASGTVGVAYTTALSITGGTAPYIVTLTSGQLPTGLHLGSHTGNVAGIPRAEGTFAFSVAIVDRWHASAAASFTMVVVGNSSPAITTATLPVGTVGVAYSATLSAAGGCAPFAWSIRRGSLPSGLSLSESTGVMSGTPRRPTNARNIVVEVTDANQVRSQRLFTLTIAEASTPVINTTQLPPATVGVAYSVKLTASGGAGDYRWAVGRGSLPGGLSLDSYTGVVSGTPTSPVISSFIVAIRDHRNALATQAESLTVVNA